MNPHIIAFLIRSSSRPLQDVSFVYFESLISLSIIRSPTRSLQFVSVINESSYCHILLKVIRSLSRSVQLVSVVYDSQHYHTILNVICTHLYRT